MKRSAFVFCSVSLLLVFGAQFAKAQVVPTASGPRVTLTVGGTASAFESDDNNDLLIGGGAFVDARFRRYIQLEAEGRWLNWHQNDGEQESNYLIGPRVPVWEHNKTTVYGKVLVGVGKMTFPYGYGYGSFTALAFGGTLDYRATRKLTIRAVDFEYQDWPVWLNNSSLLPYGVSVGVGYRVF